MFLVCQQVHLSSYRTHIMYYRQQNQGNIDHLSILKRGGPKIEPCGTPKNISTQELNVLLILVLCHLSERTQ